MPKISESISRALRDNRVSISEMNSLIREAKSQPLTAETKAQLQQLLDLHADKFGSTATRDLRNYLSTANITGTTTVTPQPPPPTVTTTIADPTVLTKHVTDTTWKPVEGGKLFVDGVSYDDVVQGSIGDCYLVSAFSAVAQTNPKAIENAIKDNGDGTFTVKFYEKGSSRQVEIKIDGDVAQSASGSQRYGKSRDSKELWVGLLEKAYAQWKGGYEAIGNGGYPGEVMQALTGRSTTYSSNAYGDSTFSRIQRGTEGGKPMTAVTYGKDSGVDYNGTGVYAWHAYTVLGATVEDGQKYVQLRNPWGSSEAGNDGKNDGIFKLKLEDFTKLYQGVDIGN